MVQNKEKAQKGHLQKHLHSRISYLYQAATYLTNTANIQRTSPLIIPEETDHTAQEETQPTTATVKDDEPNQPNDSLKALAMSPNQNAALSRRLLSHLRAVSLKSQIRLTPNLKHSICKRCDVLLVPGSTSTSFTENKSRGRKKPWADVLVVACVACGTKKRFPVGAKRQSRKNDRPAEARANGKGN